MGFKTYSGGLPLGSAGGVQASGLREIVDGEILTATRVNADAYDLQSLELYRDLCGVLAGGVCTAALLNVTIPSGTVYYARQLWISDSAVVTAVPDAATTYLWGCSDGVIRATVDTTPPGGFNSRTACIIVKAVAAAGVAVVDLTVQQQGRYSEPTNRRILEPNALVSRGFIPQMDTMPADVVATVPDGYQIQLFDSLTVYGSLAVYGKMRVL